MRILTPLFLAAALLTAGLHLPDLYTEAQPAFYLYALLAASIGTYRVLALILTK